MPRLNDDVLLSIFNTWVYSRLIGGLSLLGVEMYVNGDITQFCSIASMSGYISSNTALHPSDIASLIAMRDAFFAERLNLARVSHALCSNSDLSFAKNDL